MGPDSCDFSLKTKQMHVLALILFSSLKDVKKQKVFYCSKVLSIRPLDWLLSMTENRACF